MMKTQFMMLWDGLCTDNDATVIVVGATNRPNDLDRAILRRVKHSTLIDYRLILIKFFHFQMPAQFHIGLPSEEQRMKIFKLILEHEKVSNDVNFVQLAKITNTFSGSDLRELCRNASVYRIRSFLRDGKMTEDSNQDNNAQLPDIKMDDLMTSLQKMKLSKMHTGMMGLEMRSDLD